MARAVLNIGDPVREAAPGLPVHILPLGMVRGRYVLGMMVSFGARDHGAHYSTEAESVQRSAERTALSSSPLRMICSTVSISEEIA